MVDVYLPKKGIEGRLEPAEIALHALPDNVEVLHLMENELIEQITHLDRSNREMMDFDPNGEDMDLTEACVENSLVIREKTERLNEIKNKINKVGCNCAKHSSDNPNLDHLIAHNETAINNRTQTTTDTSIVQNETEEAISEGLHL
eukprot:GDKJ01045373.1.p1 GENE.GDKJ01045373.1~~GDKJ01045373.1.p1  ORF type:complete len:146 (-),score=35.69 GDKJ01045373.1:16-453(-)